MFRIFSLPAGASFSFCFPYAPMGKISAKIALTRWLRSIVFHAMKSLLGQYRDLHLVSLPSPLFLMTEVEKSVDRHLQGEHHFRHFGQNRLSSHFPARQNDARRRIRIFPLAEMAYAAASAFFRSPKWRTPSRPRFSARQKGVRRRIRVFPFAEMAYAAASTFFRSPKGRTPPHPHFPAR